MSKASHPLYRPDIDGLRAVAVLSVIIFHLDERLLPGGFVGVDIFFVISGFLISQQICRELEQGVFKISEFYQRRIKRIIPAMLVVIVFVLIMSLLIHRPADTQATAIQSVFSIFSLANVYFWMFADKSYFAQASGEIPLLHFWSLGVEEQFYIFWPILLILFFHRFRLRGLLITVSIIAGVSFVLGEYWYRSYPSFVYYMLPTRAGELLLGSLIAFLVVKGRVPALHVAFVNSLAVVGMACIGLSFFFIDSKSVFPGYLALLPTAGAALLIFTGLYPAILINQLLTAPPLVMVGLISYSAYLWHWPLLAFYRYAGQSIELFSGIILFLLTMVLAVATYWLVEKPIRKSKGKFWRTFTYCYALPGAIIVGLSLPIILSSGYFLHRNSQDYKALMSKSLPAFKYDYVCQEWVITKEDIVSDKCIVGAEESTEKKVLLWGDSNAAHYVGVIGAYAKKSGFQFKNLAHASCPPVNLDPGPYVLPKRYKRCAISLDNMKLAMEEYQVFIISANWTAYASRSDQFMGDFFAMVDEMIAQNKRVVLLGKVPRVDNFDRMCREKRVGLSFMDCSYEPSPLPADIKMVNDALASYALKTDGVAYYDLTAKLCPSGLCSAYDSKGEVRYYDKSHLSMPASWRIGESVIEEAGGMVPEAFRALTNW